VRRITVIYDSSVIAPFTRRWLESEPKYVPIEFVPSRWIDAARVPAGLDPAALAEHLTAIDEDGFVWRDGKAEILVLWALRRYRRRALAIGHPSRLPFRRANLNWVAGGQGEPWPDRRTDGVQG
jgi:hypothetical protein